MITLKFLPSRGLLETFIFPTAGEGGHNLPSRGQEKLSLHQGQKPHFTEKVTYSTRLKETLWKVIRLIPSECWDVNFGGSHGVRKG